MVVEDEVDWHAMVATKKNTVNKIIDMPTVVPDPALVGVIMAALKTGKTRLRWNVGIVVKKAIEKVSAGKRRSI